MLGTFIQRDAANVPCVGDLVLYLLARAVVQLLRNACTSPVTPTDDATRRDTVSRLFSHVVTCVSSGVCSPLAVPRVYRRFSLSQSTLRLLFGGSISRSPGGCVGSGGLRHDYRVLLRGHCAVDRVSLHLNCDSVRCFSGSFGVGCRVSPDRFIGRGYRDDI